MFKHILYFFHGFSVFFLYPLLAVLFALVFFLTSPDYYVKVLKEINFLPAYIEAVQEKNNSEFTQKMENNPELTMALEQQASYKSSLQLSQEYLETISRLQEEKLTERKRNELKNLSYEYAPSRFPDKIAFEKAKKEELQDLSEILKTIKALQRENHKEIVVTKRNIQKLTRQYQAATQHAQNLENKIRNEFKAMQNSFSSQLHSDLEKLSPEFNDAFNELLIEKSIRKNITGYLNFFTHYQDDKAENRIYNASFENTNNESITTNLNLPDISLQSRRVRFPDINIDFLAEQKHNAILQKRHIFRDILLEKVQGHNDLQKPQIIKTILLNLDSFLVARIISGRLSKYNFSFSGEVLQNLKPIELQGEQAVKTEKIIQIVSWLYFFRYVFAALPFVFLLSMFFPSVNKYYKLWYIMFVMIIPSLLFSLFSLFVLFYSKDWLLLWPTLASISENVFVLNMLDATVSAFARELLTPLILFWLVNILVAAVIGKIFLKIFAKQKQKRLAQKRITEKDKNTQNKINPKTKKEK